MAAPGTAVPRPRSRRRVAVLAAVVLALVGGSVWVYAATRPPISEAEATRQLRQQFPIGTATHECHFRWRGNDGTVPLDDFDFVCAPPAAAAGTVDPDAAPPYFLDVRDGRIAAHATGVG